MRMSKFSEGVMNKEERKAQEKLRKEKLSNHLYSLALAVFSVLVLGVAATFYQAESFSWSPIVMMAIGTGLYLFLVAGANTVLKPKNR